MTTAPTPARRVLVINAGSSSLKYQVIDVDSGETEATGKVDRIGGPGRLSHTSRGGTHTRAVTTSDHQDAMAEATRALAEHGPDLAAAPLFAVGHRVVHGGARFSAPTLVDDHVIRSVGELAPLAPLHNPANLQGILTAREMFPDVPHVAVFDTAFHQTLPRQAFTYAVPKVWRERHRVRRYGFHGTSHAYVSRRTAELIGRRPEECNVIVLHLGNGASICAVARGRSIDTSMGLSPLEGLVMGTRSGDVDPSLGAYLARVADLDAAAYDDALNRDSGLQGLTGSSDLREVESRCEDGDDDAAMALEVMTYRVRKYIGSYAVALGRVDALAFTGGIGENSPTVRARVLGGLGVLGVELDAAANDAGLSERLVTGVSSRIPAWVVPTNEELEIARSCRELLRTRVEPRTG